MKIRFIPLIGLLVVVLLFSQCTSGFLVKGTVPPGQAKKENNTQSAKAFAPGQQKKAAGAQSAKEFAPGQQKTAPGKSVPPGQAKKKN